MSALAKDSRGFKSNNAEDLSASHNIVSDYSTQEEMLQYKKPMKKRSHRKKEKLDLNPLRQKLNVLDSVLRILDLEVMEKRRALREEQARNDAVFILGRLVQLKKRKMILLCVVTMMMTFKNH